MTPRPAGRAALLAGAVGLALLAAGCGRATKPVTSTPASSPRGLKDATTSHTAPHLRLRGAPLGHTQTLRVGATRLSVTVLHVLRLTHTGAPALPGTRQLGVELRIANQAGPTYDSTSSGDVSLVLSSGSETPLDVRSGPCATPLVDFESMIVSGAVRSGCVAFSVPRSARVRAVRFSPHARPPGSVSWRVRFSPG